MKKYLIMLSAFTGVLLLLTAMPVQLLNAAVGDDTTHSDETFDVTTATAVSALSGDASTELCSTYNMLDITTGKVKTLSVREYLIGAVCAKMPATFESEALKAQAVAIHLRRATTPVRNRKSHCLSMRWGFFQ